MSASGNPFHDTQDMGFDSLPVHDRQMYADSSLVCFFFFVRQADPTQHRVHAAALHDSTGGPL
ncbi:hypothetical protein [Nocardia sp. NPDC051981]|uniref:hypothetical protein n=1 Tax=Nocardia sp. NPDC051981 TaxID=3155417 RepID=UPI00344A77E3